MIVLDIQEFLRDMSRLVIAAGASRPVQSELERVYESLEPFKTLTLGAFADFLVLAETYRTTDVIPDSGAKSATRKAKPNAPPADVETYATRILQLYEDVIQETVGYDAIDSFIEEMNKKLNKEEVLTVYHRFQFTGKPTKGKALEAMKHKLYQRKGSFQTAEAING